MTACDCPLALQADPKPDVPPSQPPTPGAVPPDGTMPTAPPDEPTPPPPIPGPSGDDGVAKLAGGIAGGVAAAAVVAALILFYVNQRRKKQRERESKCDDGSPVNQPVCKLEHAANPSALLYMHSEN